MKPVKRPLVIVMVLSFLIAVVPGPYLTAAVSPSSMPMPAIDKPSDSLVLPGSAATVSLQKAIEITKKHIQIPATLTNFTSNFSDYNDRTIWALNWRGGNNVG